MTGLSRIQLVSFFFFCSWLFGETSTCLYRTFRDSFSVLVGVRGRSSVGSTILLTGSKIVTPFLMSHSSWGNLILGTSRVRFDPKRRGTVVTRTDRSPWGPLVSVKTPSAGFRVSLDFTLHVPSSGQRVQIPSYTKPSGVRLSSTVEVGIDFQWHKNGF